MTSNFSISKYQNQEINSHPFESFFVHRPQMKPKTGLYPPPLLTQDQLGLQINQRNNGLLKEIDQRHFSHQQNLRHMINESLLEKQNRVYIQPHESRMFKEDIGDFIPKEKILQYESPNRVSVKKKRPLSEVPQYYYNEHQESNFSNVPDHYQNVGYYSTANKRNFDNYREIVNVSEFSVEPPHIKPRKIYDSVIIPTHLDAKTMSFLERRNNFNIKNQNEDNLQNKKNEQTKKFRNSFYLDFKERHRNSLFKSFENPYLGKILPRNENNLSSFNNNIMENVKPDIENIRPFQNDMINNNFQQESNYFPNSLYIPNNFQTNNLMNNNYPLNQSSPMQFNVYSPNFTGKDSPIQNNMLPKEFNANSPTFREFDNKAQNFQISSNNSSNKKPKPKLNLAKLPLLIQDFVILIDYDKEIERAKSILKSTGPLNLQILYRIMKKPPNSTIDVQDFARILEYLKLEFTEKNLQEFFQRCLKTDSIKLKFYDIVDIFCTTNNEISGEFLEEDLSPKLKQAISNYLKLIINREKEHKKFKLSINHNQNILDLFKDIDQTKKGYIVLEDIRKYLNKFEIFVNQPEVSAVMKIYNKSNSGRINYNEFLNEINT